VEATGAIAMTQNQSSRERRKSPRVWLRRGGQLILVKGLRGTTTVPCKVLNTSKGGALIMVGGAATDTPDDFYLTIAGQPELKIICSVVRRGKKVLGVRFIAQPDYEVRTSTAHS
jgi:PilZ domain